MRDRVRFYRGTAATTREQALRSGLELYNESSRQRGDYYSPPGVFFTWGNLDGAPTSSEGWAKMVGEREKKTPVVIDLNVTAENFHILQGKINIVRMDRAMGREGYNYIPIKDYSDFDRINGMATIQLGGLTHEDLTELGVKVGFMADGEQFDYKTYKDWSDELGVRTMTREERQKTIEGSYLQMRK